MPTTMLNLTVVDSAEDAPDYQGTEFKQCVIEHVIIVKNGTAHNKCTADLQIKTQDGEKYVTMISENLLEMLMGAMRGASAG